MQITTRGKRTSKWIATLGSMVREPAFRSWSEFVDLTDSAELRRMCMRRMKVANRFRLMSGLPEALITPEDVWFAMSSARGRCRYCGSLAVEGRPSNPINGAPTAWDGVGRRIGSLDHIVPRIEGGRNVSNNLGWCCLSCNTYKGRTDRRRD